MAKSVARREPEPSRESSSCPACEVADQELSAALGASPARADLVFVGSGPWNAETSRLLVRMTEAMGFARAEMALFSIGACACVASLQERVLGAQPKVIVTLGELATQRLSGVDHPFAQLRGHFQEWHGVQWMATLHPQDLLDPVSQKAAKRLAWEDLKRVSSALGRALPQAGASS